MPRIESKWATASAGPGPKPAPTASKPGESGDGSQRNGQSAGAATSPKDAVSAPGPASAEGDSPSKRRASHRGGRKHSKSDSSSKNGSLDRNNGEKLSEPVTPSKHKADSKRVAEDNSPAKVLQTSRWAVSGSAESSQSSPKADTAAAKHEGSPTKDRRKGGRRRLSETKASHDESERSEGLSLANRLKPRSDKPTDSSPHLAEAPRAPAAVLNAPTEPAAERERRRRESRGADTTDRPRFSPHDNGHSSRGGHGRGHGHGHGRSAADEEHERRRRLEEERERNRAKKLQGPIPEWRRDPASEAVHSQPTGYAAAASKILPPKAATQKPRKPAEPAAPAREIDLKAFEEQIAALQTGSVDWADIDDE